MRFAATRTSDIRSTTAHTVLLTAVRAVSCVFARALAGSLLCAGPLPAMQSVPAPYVDSIPGTLVRFEMVPVPGSADIEPFDIGRTEVTWDMYDVWMLNLDAVPAPVGADALARPSEPYGAPDRGWGHAGYPVISVTRAAAEAFCEWLSARTGHRYRLPTDAEWQHAADMAYPTSPRSDTESGIGAYAWHAGNAGGRTHPVAARMPDALGLFDLFGNAAEWVVTDDERNTARGGSFRDDVAEIGPHARVVQSASWNARDPQLPKSRWWLSDGPFAGFRVVREP